MITQNGEYRRGDIIIEQIPETFPDDLLWGGAFAVRRCEGEYDKDGHGLFIGGIHGHTKGLNRTKIEREGGGALAEIKRKAADAEGYHPRRYGINFCHTYKDDLALLKEMEFKYFRTSVSWSCIFPNKDEVEPNEVGLKFYDGLADKIIKGGMEPIITIPYYDIPLHLVTEYDGSGSRKVIDFFVNYGKVSVERFQGRVKYWIVCNQVNLVPTVQFGSLGIYDNQTENVKELVYQAVHDQFVVRIKIKEVGHQTDPHVVFSMMPANCTFYPATCRSKDVVLTMKKNKMQYFFSNMWLCGEYPVYALHYFKERNINIQMEDGDEEVICNNTMEFPTISYYYSRVVDSDRNGMTPMQAEQNPNLEPTLWEWRMNPLGFYSCPSQYWDRYQIPLTIGESSFGALGAMEADGSIHDPCRIDFLEKHIEQVREYIKDGVYVFTYCT